MITQTYSHAQSADVGRKPFLRWFFLLFQRETLTQEQLHCLYQKQLLRTELERARHAALLNLTAGRPF